MQNLSPSQLNEWLSSRGFATPAEIRRANPRFPSEAKYLVPQDSGRKTALSREIVRLVSGDDVLLWFSEYGVWPSSQNMPLFEGYRRAIGEIRSLAECPAHTFASQELSVLECLLDIVLYFYWDAVVFDPAKGVIFIPSHDELLFVRTQDDNLMREINSTLTAFGLKVAKS